MITGMNQWTTLTKHISCECKCRLIEDNVIQISSRIIINVDVSVKNVMYVKNIVFGIFLHIVVKMENI